MAGAGKAASDNGGAGARAAERIRSATITLKDAQVREAASQNVTKAIAEEIDRRKQLSLDLASAAAAASDAKQAVVEAERRTGARRSPVAIGRRRKPLNALPTLRRV